MMDFASKDPIGLELLKFYLPYPEDALGYMGIMGLNPADKKTGEEDQVQEPEINPEEVDVSGLQEIVFQEAEVFYEGFKSQKPPKGKPSKGKFQRRMRKRLSKAHRTYLDMGRKDLTKYGGAFHVSRKPNSSNAFLAEDDVNELSTSGGGASDTGSIEGYSSTIGKTKKSENKESKNMINKEMKQLRLKIREALAKFFNIKSQEHAETIAAILEEHELRMELREIILEQSLTEAEDPDTDVHDNTGINTIKDLFKNTNVLATLRNVYKTLTTNSDQKQSFRSHIIKWTVDTLAPVKLNDIERGTSLSEEVDVDIEGVNDDMFIDAPDGSEKDLPAVDTEEEEKMKAISGEDTTGRNKAERVYPSIEKSVVDYYAELDNPEDQEMFYDYLIANLKLYFDKWDNEMSKSVEEPTNQQYDQAKQAV